MPRKAQPTVLDEQGVAVEEAPQRYTTMEASRNATIAALAKQPRVPVYIPLPPGVTLEEASKMERPPTLVVGLNGYNILIKRGHTVMIPEAMANIVRRSGQGG